MFELDRKIEEMSKIRENQKTVLNSGTLDERATEAISNNFKVSIPLALILFSVPFSVKMKTIRNKTDYRYLRPGDDGCPRPALAVPGDA